MCGWGEMVPTLGSMQWQSLHGDPSAEVSIGKDYGGPQWLKKDSGVRGDSEGYRGPQC